MTKHNDAYIIQPNEWDYDGVYPRFCDEVNGFTIDVAIEYAGNVKLLGSSTSILDDSNCCYYDLSCPAFANRAFVDTFCNRSDMFDNNGEICIDIEVPEWFIRHCAELINVDMEYEHIFRCAFGDGGVYDSIGELRDVVFKYLIDHNKTASPSTIYDIMYVAERMGYASYNSNDGKYYVVF